MYTLGNALVPRQLTQSPDGYLHATIASMIYSIEAQTSQFVSGLADAQNAVTAAEQSMASLTTTGAGLGSSLDQLFGALGVSAGNVSGAFATAQTAAENFGGSLTNALENPIQAVEALASSLAGPLTESLGVVGVAAAAGGVAIAAALATSAVDAVELGESIQDTAYKISATADETAKLKYVFDVAGGSIEQAGNLIFMMQKQMENSPTKFQEGLANIGLNIDQLKGLDPVAMFMQIAGAFQTNTDATDRASTAMDLFSRQGRDAIPLLMKPLNDLNDSLQNTTLYSNDDAAAAEELGMKWRQLKEDAGWFGTDVGLAVIHFYEKLAATSNGTLGASAVTAATMQALTPTVGSTPIEALADTSLTIPYQTFAGAGGNMAGLPQMTMSAAELKTTIHDLTVQMQANDAANKVAAEGVKAWTAAEESAITSAQHLDTSTQTAIGNMLKGQPVLMQMAVATDQVRLSSTDLSSTQTKLTADMMNGDVAVQDNIDRQVQLTDAVHETSWGLGDLGPTMHQLTLDTGGWNVVTELAVQNLTTLSSTTSSLSSALTSLGQSSSTVFGSMATNIGSALHQVSALASTVTSLQKTFSSMTTTQAVGMGAMVVGQGISALGANAHGTTAGGVESTVGGAASGAGEGAMIGSVVPGIGTAIGAVVGGIVGGVEGLISSLGASATEQATRAARATFLTQFQSSTDTTGIQGVEDQLTQVGANAQQAQTAVGSLLDAKTPAAYAAALVPINAAIVQNTNTSTAVSSVTSLVTAWTSAGHVIPASLQATIAQLATMKGMTTAEQTALASLASSSATDFGSLTTEASNLGISLAALGPKFEQGDLEQKSATMYSTLQDLTSAGGDLGGILLGASGQISSLVDESLEFGTAIPDNMQPYIQNLIDAGKLTDANGNAITSIAQLTFENTPLTTSLTTLNTAAQTLVSTLNKVPAAVAAAGGSSTGGGVPVPAFAAGVLDAPGGWAIVGEQGPEAMYVPRGANIYPTGSGASPMPGAPGATGGSGGGTVVIQLDSKTIASLVVPQLVGQIRRYGIGRNWSGAS